MREISDVIDGSATLKISGRCSPSTVNEKAAFKSVAVMQCDVKFCDNVVDDSQHFCQDDGMSRLTVVATKCNEILRTNLAPELTEQGKLHDKPTRNCTRDRRRRTSFLKKKNFPQHECGVPRAKKKQEITLNMLSRC